ncbi:cysteine proteinase [Penicillium malachiteum]|nr:cysteine proteinase [Penicillium malachiteum]
MSCTANAVASAFEFCVQAQRLPEFTPSSFFIWYNARAKSTVEDALKKCVGCSMKNAVQSLDFTRHGVCSEELWPYDIDEYNKKNRYLIKKDARAARNPPASVEKDAHLHSCTRPHYRRISGKNLSSQIEDRLTAGRPVLFGINIHFDPARIRR